MKRIIMLVLLFLFYFPLAGRAQICNEGQSLGVISGIQTVLQGPSGTSVMSTHEIFGFRLSNGEIMYVVNLESIQFVAGDPSVVDRTSTAAIFSAIAESSVRKGYDLGYYNPCPSTCGTPLETQVRQNCCVDRFGTGLATKFKACEISQCCIRTYTICCPEGAPEPEIKLKGATGGPCSGDECHNTCPPPL